jgi:hypothetical protein
VRFDACTVSKDIRCRDAVLSGWSLVVVSLPV